MKRKAVKILIVLVVMACMTLSLTPSFAITPDNFTDVPANHWAYQAVMNMARLGVIMGYPDGTFKPDQFVSREEFAKILCGATSIPIANPVQNSFADVTAADWSFRYVETVKDYLTGYPSSDNGKPLFKGKQDATREDVAVALVKIKGFDKTVLPDPTILSAMFKDTDSISSKVKNLVAIAVQKKLVQGYGDSTFRGTQPVTRAEAAVLIDRANTIAGDVKEISPSGGSNNGGQSTDLLYVAVDCSKSVGKVGEKIQASAKGFYSDGHTSNLTGDADWSSSNDSILAVDDNGKVYLLKEGTAKISASFNGKSDEQDITVLPNNPGDSTDKQIKFVMVTPESAELKVGSTLNLKAEVVYNNGTVTDITNGSSWDSSNTAVALVSSKGNVYGVKEGTVLIKAMYQNHTAYAAVRVNQNPPPPDTKKVVLEGINLSERIKQVNTGDKISIKAIGKYSDSSEKDITGKAAWSTSSDKVAKIESNGQIKAVGKGLAIITAALDGKSADMFVVVEEAPPSPVVLNSIVLSEHFKEIIVGNKLSLKATGKYSDSSEQDITNKVTWSTSDDKVARIGNNGEITAVGKGVAVITAAMDQKSCDMYIAVEEAAQINPPADSQPAVLRSISVSEHFKEIDKGEKCSVKATGKYTDGSEKDITSSVAWRSSNEKVAVVDASGQVTAVGKGIAVITAAMDEKSSNLFIMVVHG